MAYSTVQIDPATSDPRLTFVQSRRLIRQEESFMGAKFKTILFGTLVAGSLALSAAPALAGYWDWPYRDYRDSRDYRYRDSRGYAWSRREDLFRQLDYARRKLAYDRTHHASRERLAHDNRRIEDLLREIDFTR
jgi:hypothetical protein